MWTIGFQGIFKGIGDRIGLLFWLLIEKNYMLCLQSMYLRDDKRVFCIIIFFVTFWCEGP